MRLALASRSPVPAAASRRGGSDPKSRKVNKDLRPVGGLCARPCSDTCSVAARAARVVLPHGRASRSHDRSRLSRRPSYGLQEGSSSGSSTSCRTPTGAAVSLAVSSAPAAPAAQSTAPIAGWPCSTRTVRNLPCRDAILQKVAQIDPTIGTVIGQANKIASVSMAEHRITAIHQVGGPFVDAVVPPNDGI